MIHTAGPLRDEMTRGSASDHGRSLSVPLFDLPCQRWRRSCHPRRVARVYTPCMSTLDSACSLFNRVDRWATVLVPDETYCLPRDLRCETPAPASYD